MQIDDAAVGLELLGLEDASLELLFMFILEIKIKVVEMRQFEQLVPYILTGVLMTSSW